MNSNHNPVAGRLLLAGLLAVSAAAQDPIPDFQGATNPGRAALTQDLPVAPDAGQELGSATRLGVELPGLRTPIHTAADDQGLRYGIWAAGDGYKASFHDGMTFVPYLGAGYPHNQPLSWRTTSAKVGNVELLEHGIEPAHAAQDFRYEYRFGAVTEAYDVRSEGLEQTFVINQLPVAGDLVITGAVTSLLRSQNLAPAHQALEFVDHQGRAITGYGAAIAFDAVGSQVPVATGYKDGLVTLTVPGGWLANAALPVVVDPLLTRVQIATSGITIGLVGEIDIARDDEAVTSNVMITYIRNASASDADLWARLQNDDYAGTSIVFTDITSSWDTDETSCAFVGGANRWVVVMRRFFGSLTPTQSRIRCHVHDSGDTTLQTSYSGLATSANRNEWRPDVGGVESYYSGDDAMVVFQSEDNGTGNFAGTATSEVWGVVLDPTTANGTFGAEFPIYSSPLLDCERPSVNQVATGAASISWICALQIYTNSITADDWDVAARRIDNLGNVSSGTFFSDLNALGTTHQMGPVVEGSDGRYAVAFSTTDTATTAYKTGYTAGKDLRVERFDWSNNASSPSGDKPPVFLRGNSDRRWEATGLGFDTDDDSHFGLGFRAVSPGVPAAYYARLGYNGRPTEGPISTTLYYTQNHTPTMVACVYDNDHDDFLFAYGVDDGTTALPVYGHTVTYATPPSATVTGNACGNATIGYFGNQQIGSEFNTISVNNNAAVGHFLLVSLATTNVPVIDPNVFPGCRLLVEAAGPNYLGTMSFQFSANPSWNLALPEWLGPMTLHFQDWYFDGNFFYNTQRLSLPLIK